MWAVIYGLFATSLFLTSDGQQEERLCPKPALPSDAQLSPVGVDVNLTCLEGPWEDTATFTWRLNNRTLGLRRYNRGVLLLKSVRHRDSGNYTCYKDGVKLRNIHLLVGEVLETPNISCTAKFPDGKIRCEWQPSNRPSPTTKAVLLMQKGLKSQPTTEPCSYYSSQQRFACRLKLAEGDHDTHVVSLCLTSVADSQLSEFKLITGYTVLRPDPPMNVTVRVVKGAPRQLNVTWQYPRTWNPDFYKLHFEVKYCIEHTTITTTTHVLLKTFCLIMDAVMGRKHVVQVRAQEEYKHGSWSEWSQEDSAVPWTDPGQQEVELPHTSFPADYSREDMYSSSAKEYNYRDYVQTAISGRPPDIAEDWGRLHIPQYTFIITGISLVFGIVLFVGILIRYKTKWQRESVKGGNLQHIFPFCPLRKQTEEEPKAQCTSIPLVSPPSSPTSIDPTSDGEDSPTPGTYDITNRNYFLLPR